MPDSILPPLPTAAPPSTDVDSLAARQARNLSQVQSVETGMRQAQWTAFGRVWSLAWGVPAKVKAPDGTITTNPAVRANENNLSPVDAWAGFGTGATAYLQAFGVELAAAVEIDPTVGLHPVTGEDMTAAPAGWNAVPQPDGSVLAAYTAPTAPPASPASAPAPAA